MRARGRLSRGSSLGLLLALAAAPLSRAHATYSIVASDGRSKQLGGAGASCVYPSAVTVIYGVAPGFGAVHAQAQVNEAGRDRAVQLLGMGQTPEAVIAAITAAGFDRSASLRQYGVVDVMGRSAGYTGAQNSMFADDLQGSIGSFTYSVQGNILTGADVLEQASDAFEGGGCDLADRLMRALEAGAKNNQGDTRCTGPSSIAANSAFIQVDLPGMPAGSYLKLSAGSGRGVDPLPALRRAYDTWRSTHPCANPSDAGVLDAGAAFDGGVFDAGSALDAAALDAAFRPDAPHVEGGVAPSALEAGTSPAASTPDGSTSGSIEAGAIADASAQAPGLGPASVSCGVGGHATTSRWLSLLLLWVVLFLGRRWLPKRATVPCDHVA